MFQAQKEISGNDEMPWLCKIWISTFPLPQLLLLALVSMQLKEKAFESDLWVKVSYVLQKCHKASQLACRNPGRQESMEEKVTGRESKMLSWASL